MYLSIVSLDMYCFYILSYLSHLSFFAYRIVSVGYRINRIYRIASIVSSVVSYRIASYCTSYPSLSYPIRSTYLPIYLSIYVSLSLCVSVRRLPSRFQSGSCGPCGRREVRPKPRLEVRKWRNIKAKQEQDVASTPFACGFMRGGHLRSKGTQPLTDCESEAHR